MSFLYSTPLCFRDVDLVGAAANRVVSDSWLSDQCKLLHEVEELPCFWSREDEDSVLFGISEIRDILIGGGSVYLVEDFASTDPLDEFFHALFFDTNFETYSVRMYGVRY